ncbi:MAG: metallophosphoesterase [Eubacteriales bacterium]|nr:metallophosphoesterase [Eubacteriales bacterium]
MKKTKKTVCGEKPGGKKKTMIYITGDTHGDFSRIETFCRKMKTTTEDVLIILGDAGINYYGRDRDRLQKEEISRLPVTLFCIHGNHEQRPENIKGYHESGWHGGTVYKEDDFPTLLFAKDGEIYDIAGRKTVVIGGAYRDI